MGNGPTDTEQHLIARAIVGGAYLVASAVLFVGIGVLFISSSEPKNGGSLMLSGIFLLDLFLFGFGLKELAAVSKASRRLGPAE